MVVPCFVKLALLNESITVFGDGRQTRTFTHVKDAVWAILRLAELPNAIGEIFNIGGKTEVSINSLASLVKEILQSASPITQIPYEEAYEEGFEDMRKRVPDISKIQNLIGYEPQYGLRDIIVDVANHEKRNIHRPNVAR